MGIPTLLQGLKCCVEKQNISDFKGKAVAIDLSSWLHRSVYSIAPHAVECMEAGPPDAHCQATAVQYVQRRCHEFHQYAGIAKIFLVMDGVRCPLKAVTTEQRDQRRAEQLRQARALVRRGDTQAAFERYKACIQIPAALAQSVAQTVAQKCPYVQLVWSPYEADAQMVYLATTGQAHAIITEDSDVLVYAVACQSSVPILYKLQRNGQCDVISNPLQRKAKNTRKTSGLEPTLPTFSQHFLSGKGVRPFVQACILTGCDYHFNRLQGVGLVHAFRNVAKALVWNDNDRIWHILKRQLPPKATMAIRSELPAYAERLRQAEAVFFYHPVRHAHGHIVWLQDPVAANLPPLDCFADKRFLGEMDQSDPDKVILLDPIDSSLVQWSAGGSKKGPLAGWIQPKRSIKPSGAKPSYNPYAIKKNDSKQDDRHTRGTDDRKRKALAIGKENPPPSFDHFRFKSQTPSSTRPGYAKTQRTVVSSEPLRGPLLALDDDTKEEVTTARPIDLTLSTDAKEESDIESIASPQSSQTLDIQNSYRRVTIESSNIPNSEIDDFFSPPKDARKSPVLTFQTRTFSAFFPRNDKG